MSLLTDYVHKDAPVHSLSGRIFSWARVLSRVVRLSYLQNCESSIDDLLQMVHWQLHTICKRTSLCKTEFRVKPLTTVKIQGQRFGTDFHLTHCLRKLTVSREVSNYSMKHSAITAVRLLAIPLHCTKPARLSQGLKHVFSTFVSKILNILISIKVSVYYLSTRLFAPQDSQWRNSG